MFTTKTVAFVSTSVVLRTSAVVFTPNAVAFALAPVAFAQTAVAVRTKTLVFTTNAVVFEAKTIRKPVMKTDKIGRETATAVHS